MRDIGDGWMEHVEVRWGVQYLLGSSGGREPGYVEQAGTRPGGDVGVFSKEDCEYIAGRVIGARVVRRETVVRQKMGEWEVWDEEPLVVEDAGPRHNHMTRDVKLERGVCPACDEITAGWGRNKT